MSDQGTTTIPFIKHQPLDLRLPPVYVTYITIQRVWTLVDPYHITLPVTDGVNLSFEIPMGFDFDLASIPRFIWPLISSFELSLVAPLIHDYFYQYQGQAVFHYQGDPIVRPPVTRATADKMFLDLMIREGVPNWKARAAYSAVRLFATRW